MTGLAKKNGDLAVGIVKITKNPGTTHTGGNTGWFFSFIQTVLTKRTFISHSELLVNITNIIRTGSNTGLTTHTFFAVNLDSAIFFVMGSACGADIHTRGFITVITELRPHLCCQVRKGPLDHFKDPGAVMFRRYIVFALACHHTCHAADAS
jgi:hypothetical protein